MQLKTPVSVVEGEVAYDIPSAGKPCKTWYKVYGDLKSRVPLVIVHGGPGCTHQYLLPHIDLTEQYAIPVVFYDQVGCGKSTHLQEKAGDESFWTMQLWIDELHNLLKHLGIGQYDLLGNSWGCMLGAEFVSTRPKGLRRAILSCGPASSEEWMKSTRSLLKTFSKEEQNIVKINEWDGTIDNPEYQAVLVKFFHKHTCRLDPWPAGVESVYEEAAQDPTVYSTLFGTSEFTVSGSLRHWTVIPKLKNINVPVLITNGRYDAAQDNVMVPFFEEIPQVKWYKFAESSHMPHWEERELYMRLIAGYLSDPSSTSLNARL